MAAANKKNSSTSLCLVLIALFSLLNSIPGLAWASPSPRTKTIDYDMLSFHRIFQFGDLFRYNPIGGRSFINFLSLDRIFQFGDSLSDTGNLIRDNPIGGRSFINFPYGKTINRPTGRCSDGLLMIDFIAKFFHLPPLNPFLDHQANFTHGVNFAVAGSTALDTSSLLSDGIASPATNSSLSVQLKWFESHIRSLCGDNLACKKSVVRKSLVMMGEVGGNDYNYALLEGRPMDQIFGMVPEVVRAIKEAVEKLIVAGAIRIVVPGNFPIGCMPIYLALFETQNSNMYDEIHCLKQLNDLARFHNRHLKTAIRELGREHPNVAIIYGDYYWGLRWIIKKAGFLGFKKDGLQKTCCGANDNRYNFNITRMCGSEGTNVCENADEKYSWDGIHLTQHAYFHMAQWLLQSIVPGILRIA